LRSALIVLALVASCKKEPPRTHVGPVSLAIPEGFVEDSERMAKMASVPGAQQRMWVNKAAKLQLGLSLAKLGHQPEWDAVPRHDLLSEMVNQEMTAGEKAGLKTVRSDRKFDGDALHYTVDGDLAGLLATSNHTALWLDAAGDCWHASAVCSSKPDDRAKCAELLGTVKFAIDAGVSP
jgi:hypothetical protein